MHFILFPLLPSRILKLNCVSIERERGQLRLIILEFQNNYNIINRHFWKLLLSQESKLVSIYHTVRFLLCKDGFR